jgi:hypothetical protein
VKKFEICVGSTLCGITFRRTHLSATNVETLKRLRDIGAKLDNIAARLDEPLRRPAPREAEYRPSSHGASLATRSHEPGPVAFGRTACANKPLRQKPPEPLGWQVSDKTIVDAIAGKANVRRELIESLDEQDRKRINRIAASSFPLRVSNELLTWLLCGKLFSR